jgi:hypothetical protein
MGETLQKHIWHAPIFNTYGRNGTTNLIVGEAVGEAVGMTHWESIYAIRQQTLSSNIGSAGARFR